MGNVDKVKTKKVLLTLGGKERTIVYDFNALALVEEVHGDIDKAFQKLTAGIPVALLRDLIWAGTANTEMNLKTGEMAISKFEVGAWLQDFGNLQELMTAVAEAFNNSMPDAEDEEDEKVVKLPAPGDGGEGN